jgi:hypothetical protein
MTSDFGVASRRILQLIVISLIVELNKRSSEHLPFIKFDLEGTGIGEHVVVCSHASEDIVHGT